MFLAFSRKPQAVSLHIKACSLWLMANSYTQTQL